MQTLAKFQVTAISPMQDVRKNRFTQIYRDLNGDAMLVPIQMLEELKNIKIILFLIQELFR